ncbi:hypothetical protein EXS53_02675 [Patescibacteria group bacterium]|nr:hypothetical protein [Patescibacteria group bacterium]
MRFDRILGWLALILFTIAAVGYLVGWRVSFHHLPACEGERSVEVGSAGTYWEIAEREFPNKDIRLIVDAIVALNGGDLRVGTMRITVPLTCE